MPNDPILAGPLLGVFLVSMGGIFGGCFYAPLTQVKQWSWETHWLAMGIVARGV